MLRLFFLISPVLAYVPVYRCELDVEGERLIVEHGEYQYMAGVQNVRSSLYGHCYNGTLTCFEDLGVQDAVARESVACNGTEIAARRRLAIASDPTTEWPLNTVCYQIQDQTFTPNQEALLQQAFDEYNADTNLNLITTAACEALPNRADLCGNCANYIMFLKDQGCYSSLGYQAEAGQPISLVDGCFDVGTGTVLHEIGHAIGMYHEQAHINREVIVLRDDIVVPPGNYMKIQGQVIQVTQYDRQSMMHYPLGRGLCVPLPEFKDVNFCDIIQDERDGCTVPGPQHCDTSITSANSGIGQRQGFSPGDLNHINQMYPALA